MTPNDLAEELGEYIASKLESQLPRGKDLRSLSIAPKECKDSQYLAEWSIRLLDVLIL